MRVTLCNMEDVLKSSVEIYVDLPPDGAIVGALRLRRALRHLAPPETHEQAPAAVPPPIARNPDQLGSDPEDVGPQGGVSPAEGATKNVHTVVARVVMKVMYATRTARPDLLRSIAYVARCLIGWAQVLLMVLLCCECSRTLSMLGVVRPRDRPRAQWGFWRVGDRACPYLFRAPELRAQVDVRGKARGNGHVAASPRASANAIG